jgi:hypothetical protein
MNAQSSQSRREFLADVGRGMLIASVGFGTAVDLGLAPASAGEAAGDDRLTFGAIEPLVGLMQETPAGKIVDVAVEKIRGGTSLRELVAAAALANARTFGGEDYVGFHTVMALAPSLHMAGELPEPYQPLPVLKVLHRNAGRIQEYGGKAKEVLRRVEPLCCLPDDRSSGEALRDAVRGKDVLNAEQTFATIAQGPADRAFNDLLWAVMDNTEVHRVVLPYRAWDLMGLVGRENAHTLLRQSVRYCVKSERDWKHSAETDRPRGLLTELMERHKLLGRKPGSRAGEDGWVDHLAKAIFEGTPEAAADAAAAALAEGFDPRDVGEALSLAANQLVLRDAGRTAREVQPNKPLGSVHGDSIGVHACDSANAWRNMSRAGNDRNVFACLILGAYQMAYDRVNRGGDFLHWAPRPSAELLEALKPTDPAALLREAEAAIRANDQGRSCAVVQRIGDLGQSARPVFDLLLRFAISEDGALHAEKYYRTVSEEFAATRPAFRWRQLVALSRVTASEFGRPAPGVDEASRRLGV